MTLEELTIRRLPAWQDKSRPLVGTLTVAGTEAKTELRLDDAQCRQILIVAGESIKSAAAEVASFLKSEASLLQLEAPTEAAK